MDVKKAARLPSRSVIVLYQGAFVILCRLILCLLEHVTSLMLAKVMIFVKIHRMKFVKGADAHLDKEFQGSEGFCKIHSSVCAKVAKYRE